VYIVFSHDRVKKRYTRYVEQERLASNPWKNEGDFFPESEAINNFAEAK